MIGDKEKLHSYIALEKEKNVSFGNDTPAVIKGKGFVFLKEKVKAGNVMYVDGLKHNLLSVSQMCDQGNEEVFGSNGCVVRELDTGETMIKGTRTQNNLYILKGGQQQCYLSKNDESWLWHKRLGHLSFSQIRKACRFQEVRDLPDINIPENTIENHVNSVSKPDLTSSKRKGILKHKDEAFEKFKAFKALGKIKCLRFDRGGELTSDEFFDFCEQHEIKR
eukprot:PITA_03057